MSGNLSIDLPDGEFIEAALFRTGPCLSQPFGRGLHVLQEVLHAEDYHCRLATTINNKALSFANCPVHELPELSPRHVRIDTAIHLSNLQYIN